MRGVRVRGVRDRGTRELVALEVEGGDVAQALAFVAGARADGLVLPPVLVDADHGTAAVTPLLELARVTPERLLVRSPDGSVRDGAGRRYALPPTTAERWVDETQVASLLRPRRSRRAWGAVAALAVVATVVFLLWGRGGAHDDEPNVDQSVAAAADAPLARQGFNLTAWRDSDYNSRHARTALSEAAKLGANTVAIVVTQYVDGPHATDIHRVADKTPSDDSLRRIVQLAHRMGFYVSIKPHVDTLDGTWRGDINPHDFRAFATSYRAFILHYADLAQATHAEELVAGTELKALTLRVAQEGRIHELIHLIRARFHGELGYAANWDNALRIPFWRDADFIGIDAYYPLVRGTVADMVAAWAPYKAEALHLSREYGKPIVFTEAGYQNRAGASETPWGVPSEATLDDPEQDRALRALFRAWGDQPELRGVYLWQLYAGDPADLDPGDWSIVGKPAAAVVKHAYATTTPGG
jgi:hypothetical protein